ncbi:MAG TPA: hypothetical protein VF719_01290 [Abditibacteriaceae bacterium]|jgi:hypothetical protein
MTDLYRHAVRYQAQGHWGTNRDPISINVMAEAAWKAAVVRNAVTNLRRLKVGNDEKRAALLFTYKPFFPAAWNQKAAWTALAGGTWFNQLPNAFRGSTPALAYTRNAVDTLAKFQSITAKLGKNQGLCLRGYLFRPDSTQKRPIHAFDWDLWSFRIVDGQAEIILKSAAWTQSLEDQLHALLKLDNLSQAQQASADALAKQIYSIRKSVSLGNGEAWYDNPFIVTFLPEARGILTVEVEGGQSDSVEVPNITKTRAIGTLWNSTVLYAWSNGPDFQWQAGYPNFAVTGELRLGKYIPGSDYPGGMVINGQWDNSAPGCTVTADNQDVTEIHKEVVIKLAGNGFYSPFLYAGDAYVEAGARNGPAAIVFDTNDHLDSGGNSPVIDFRPTYEKENRRCNATLSLRNNNGTLGILGGALALRLEDRMGNISVAPARAGGVAVPMLAKAICRSLVHEEISEGTANVIPAIAAKAGTICTAQFSDMWALADEFLIKRPWIGDGRKVGAHLRTGLRQMGCSNGEMSGVQPNQGRFFPQAALGENPCVQPQADTPLGDYMRSVVERWGMGLRLTAYTGVWRLEKPSTAIKAVFKKESLGPGRYRIINPNLPRDFGDSFNLFRVEGSPDENGQAITREWRFHESISSPNHPSFIGRIKAYKTVRDEGLRTVDDVLFVLRSLTMAHSKPGHFIHFETHFHVLFPGDRITVDGVLYEIERIPAASTAEDMMQIVARQVIPMAGGLI